MQMTKKIFVVGKTTPKEVFVATTSKPFIIDEYVKIEDSSHSYPIGEVIETNAYAKIEEGTFSKETGIYQSLLSLQLIEKETTLFIAKIKLLDELQTPIMPDSEARRPDFSDIEQLLVKREPGKGFTLGVIRGTEHVQAELPSYLSNVSPLFDSGKGVIPQQGIPFILDHFAFREYPHIALFGGSGSGKTFGLRVICEEIMRKKVPGIVLDPHYELSFQKKMPGVPIEFEEEFSQQHEIFQFGVNVGINFSELITAELISLVEHVSDLTEPMRGALEQLHQKNDSYTTLINRVKKLLEAFQYHEKSENEKRRMGDLSDESNILYAKYQNKVAGLATLQAVAWRLEKLNSTGIFNCDIHQVESCMLKRKLAVIRGKHKHLLMLSSYLIGKTYGHRRAYQDFEQANMHGDLTGYTPKKFPPFFIVMDESHLFAPDGKNNTPTKRVLREIAQEARKYGVFLVLGTQRPALLDSTIVSQMNTKIIFRTGIESDMKMIQTETNLNQDQMLRLPELSSGNAFVSSATLQKTFYIRFRVTKTVSPHSGHPFDELDDFDDSSKLQEVLLNFLPISNTSLPQKHSKINNEMGKAIAQKEIFEALDTLEKQGKVTKRDDMFGKEYKAV